MSARRKRSFILAHDAARRNACAFIMAAPVGDAVTVGEPNRTLEQNSAQWPYLAGFAQQLQWPINGEMTNMSEDDWKDVLTAAFKRETQRIAMGLDGGFVMLGQRTSQFGKAQFSEWMEFLVATAAMRGVTPIYKNPKGMTA